MKLRKTVTVLTAALIAASAVPLGSEKAPYCLTARAESLFTVTETSPSGGAVSYNGQQKLNNATSAYHGTGYYIRVTPIDSCLTQNSDGTYTRVENFNGIHIETYSPDLKRLLSKSTIPSELSEFGGIFLGEDYNFAVFGQDNPNYDDSVEVIRIVKYSKDWKRLSCASVRGANTYEIFEAGTVRFTELDGVLYLHCSHSMYPMDGVNHQANMSVAVNESDMTVAFSNYGLTNAKANGYVSHSFDQFIVNDGEYIYRLDLGDALPRAVFLSKSRKGSFRTVGTVNVLDIGGNIGDNETGCGLGGIELSRNSIIVAGSSMDQTMWNVIPGWYAQYNVFVSIIDKNDLSKAPKTVYLTDHEQGDELFVGAPKIVKLSEDCFLIMWEEADTKSLTAKAMTIDGQGNILTEAETVPVRLSECKPILCRDGLVRWYTSLNSTPTFYALKAPVPESFILGDVNGDGVISATDVTSATAHVKEIKHLSDSAVQRGDIDGDGKLTASDAAAISAHVKGVKLLP